MLIHVLVHLLVSDLSHDSALNTSEDTQSAVNGSVRSFYSQGKIVSSLRPGGVVGGIPPYPLGLLIPRDFYLSCDRWMTCLKERGQGISVFGHVS